MDGQGKKIKNEKDEMVLQSIYKAENTDIQCIYETTW